MLNTELATALKLKKAVTEHLVIEKEFNPALCLLLGQLEIALYRHKAILGKNQIETL